MAATIREDAPYKEFAERLAKLRQDAGLTRAELGEKIGVAGRSIINYENGERIPYGDVCARMAGVFGITTDELLGVENPELEMARAEYGTNIFLKPGAGEFLRQMKQCGLKLGTVSGLPHALSDAVLEHNGVRTLFDAFTSADDAVRGKEYPDVYLLAARRLGVDPERCVVFEDVTACALSAREAGMTVCAVYDGQSDPEWEALTRAAHFSARSYGELRETGCFGIGKLL